MTWKIAKLGNICKIQSGNSIPVKEKEALYRNVEDGLPYVATKDVGFNGVIDYENGVRIPSNYSSKFKLSKKNSTLVCAEGGSAGRKVAFSTKDCYFVNKLFSINPGSEMVSKYIYYYTLSDEFQNQFKNSLHGLIGGVSLSKIKGFQITYPSISEQQLKVAKLDTAFTEINKGIEITNKKIENTNTLFKNYLTKFFSNNNNKLIKLKDVCTATQGVQISKSNQIKSPKKGYLRYLYISDFSHNKNVKYIENKYPKKIVQLSDIIVANTGASAGSIFRGVEGILSNNLFKVTPNKSLIDSDFLYYFVTSKLFKNFQKKIMRGTANPHMGHENFLNTPLNLPNIDEQKEIVLKIFELEKNIKTLNQNYSNKIESLNQLKLKILFFNLNNAEAA